MLMARALSQSSVDMAWIMPGPMDLGGAPAGMPLRSSIAAARKLLRKLGLSC